MTRVDSVDSNDGGSRGAADAESVEASATTGPEGGGRGGARGRAVGGGARGGRGAGKDAAVGGGSRGGQNDGKSAAVGDGARGEQGVVAVGGGSGGGQGVVGVGAPAGGPGGASRGVQGGVNLLALRSHNTALVLDLLRTAGPEGISRLELAERTGLTPQAVSKITGRLREEGFAAEAGRRASTGGKPRTVLRLVPDAGHAVGVHLDRDETRVVLCDLTGAAVAETRTAVGLGAGAGTVIDEVARQVEALLPGARGSLLGVGVALPGPLDHLRGVLHRVTGFPDWDGFPLRDALAARLAPAHPELHDDGAAGGDGGGGAGEGGRRGSSPAAAVAPAGGKELPVVVDKDTNAAALGLAVAGEGGGGGSFAYLHLGTGLGAGLVIGGGVHRGARTGAGEFGHQVIQLDGPPCDCGNRGCVEALCLAAVARGDVAEAARVLGAGAANLVGLLDIDLVLLGGRTIAAAPEEYLHGVGEVLAERARREGTPDAAVPVRLAPGGGHAVAEGAAQLLLGPLFGRADA